MLLISLLGMALASSGRGLVTLSLPVGIHTYFMTRELGTLSWVLSRLAAGVFGAADGSVMTGVVITHKTFSLTFFTIDTTAFQAAVSTLCTSSPSYSIAYPVALPINLSVRVVIAKVSWSSLDSRYLRCTNSTPSGMSSAPNPRIYQLNSP